MTLVDKPDWRIKSSFHENSWARLAELRNIWGQNVWGQCKNSHNYYTDPKFVGIHNHRGD